jgi:hypothetical protein
MMAIEGLDTLEQAVLDKLLAGDHPVLTVLRLQTTMARVAGRKQTGVGFFCDFEVDESAPILPSDFHIGDVFGELEGLAHGAGFVLFVRDGRLSMLEGFTFDEPWPQEVRGFKLAYHHEPRELKLPEPSGVSPS